MKLNLKNFKLIDIENYKKTIDNICKAVLPKSMLRSKKTEKQK